MTPQSQRIAIAEACGWVLEWDGEGQDQTLTIYRPNGDKLRPLYINTIPPLVVEKFPDYLSDLNAMHEAEQTLTKEQCSQFNSLLMECKPPRSEISNESEKWSWHATASQRAEAFLKTLGLWKSSQASQTPTPTRSL